LLVVISRRILQQNIFLAIDKIQMYSTNTPKALHHHKIIPKSYGGKIKKMRKVKETNMNENVIKIS
jgi:hypothetical protein